MYTTTWPAKLKQQQMKNKREEKRRADSHGVYTCDERRIKNARRLNQLQDLVKQRETLDGNMQR